MKKKIEYTDGSMSESEITIEISTRTVDFFKNQAEKSNFSLAIHNLGHLKKS